MSQIQINHAQAQALVEVLQDNTDGEPVLFTWQGNGTLTVAFNLVTFDVDTAGVVTEA